MKTKARTFTAFAAAALAAISMAIPAHAATIFRSGAGVWDTSTLNWGTVTGGPYNTASWSNATPDSAVLEGTAGLVTLSQNINIENLTFSVPNAAVAGYFIGDAAEDNFLNFSGTKTITLNATGTGTNQDMTIRAGITGSPTLNIAGRLNNSQFFALEPTANVTMTLGQLNMTNTNASNKQLRLGGNSLGNVVDQITWTVTANQLQVRKQATTNSGPDATSWTINQNIFLDDGRIFVDEGTLILKGTSNFISHAIETQSGGRIGIQGVWKMNDTREDFRVQSGGIVAPGNGVGTVTFSWNTTGASIGEVDLQNGSIYEWEVGALATDVIDVQKFAGGGNANIKIGNMTLKILDAGSIPGALPELLVFTYGTGVTVSPFGTVTFDTSALGSNWKFSNLSLVDNGQGKILLTGLTNQLDVPEPATASLALLGLGGLMMRRRRPMAA